MERSLPATGLMRSTAIEAMAEVRHVHQFNRNAVRLTRRLGDATGLARLGIHLVRLAPGRESTQYHRHSEDDEFVYILAGRAVAQIDDAEVEVGGGDFMGFPAGGPAHAMHNPFAEDCLYLMGGNRSAMDVCDYPRIGKRMYRIRGRREAVDLEHLETIAQALPSDGAV